MRIAILNSYYAPDEVGGAEKSIRFIAESLVEAGHDVKVLCTGRSEGREVLNGVVVDRLPVKNIYHPLDAKKHGRLEKMVWHSLDSFSLAGQRLVENALKDFKPQVLHSNTLAGISVSAWRAARKLRIPIVHTLRDYYLLCPNSAMFRNGKQCVHRCGSCQVLSLPRRIASDMVNTVVGNSHFILNKHLEAGYFRNAMSSVIYNAYQPEREAQPIGDRSQVIFGFLGRLAPTKGIEILLDAVRTLYNQRRDFRLVIAGEAESTEYEARLAAKSAKLPVDFLGRVPPQEFFSKIHWCVLPSTWHEPLARVSFESFAHGIPLLASRTGGTTEVVREGKNGFLYEAEDKDALARLMLQAIEQPVQQYQDLQRACFEDAKNFLPDRVIANYMEVYRSTTNSAGLFGNTRGSGSEIQPASHGPTNTNS